MTVFFKVKHMYFMTAAKGYLYASQFCYLMAGCPFQDAAVKTAKLVLLGANHT